MGIPGNTRGGGKGETERRKERKGKREVEHLLKKIS